MIYDQGLQDLIAVALYSALCFVLGVSWAAYRAVGWVERMRAWAHAVQIDGSNEDMPALVGSDEGATS